MFIICEQARVCATEFTCSTCVCVTVHLALSLSPSVSTDKATSSWRLSAAVQREFEHTSLHGFRPLDVLNANDGVKPTVVENVNRLQGAVNGILNEQDIQVACCTLTTETRLHRHV